MIEIFLALALAPRVAAAPQETVTLDRVVASIENRAITQSDIEMEYRFELFLDGKVPSASPDAAALERARDRLIEQGLLALEMSVEGTDAAGSVQAARDTLAEVRKRFADEQTFQSALRLLGLNEPQVLEGLSERWKALRMVDQRLRPAAWPERAEIEAYYRDNFVPEYAQRGSGSTPPLSEVESQIREILTQRKINELLETWLYELRSTHRVVIHSL